MPPSDEFAQAVGPVIVAELRQSGLSCVRT
jgi:hypothetical protein